MNCTFLKQILTESDNETHDIFRWLALISVVVALALQVYVVVWKGQPFDMMNFGTGIGVVLGGAGVALNLKRDSQSSAGGTP